MISDENRQANNRKWLKHDDAEMCRWAKNYIQEKWVKYIQNDLGNATTNDYEFVLKSIERIYCEPEGKALIGKLKHAWSAEKSRKKNNQKKLSWIKVKLSHSHLNKLEKITRNGKHENISEALESLIFSNHKVDFKKTQERHKKNKDELENKRKELENIKDRNQLKVNHYSRTINTVCDVIEGIKDDIDKDDLEVNKKLESVLALMKKGRNS
jgi:hypothetical protein